MMTKDLESVGVIVITHTAKKHLQYCLPPLLQSSLRPRVLVVNSSSHDGTVEEAERLGAETLTIPRADFNHGSTREMARKYLGTDIVVMITPDAYPLDEHMLGHLVTPLLKKEAVVSYARQIAHDRAGIFESFPRGFNYPAKNQLRGRDDFRHYGVYTYFCSNSCAAYRNSALDEIGGFKSVLTGEDTLAVALLLKKGYKIAYVANAVVKHSHTYTLLQEFRRYFDTGYYRRQYQDLLAFGGKDESRGKVYLVEFLKAVWQDNPFQLPYAFLQTLAKWLGYRVGRLSLYAPLWWKKLLSNQDFYWVSRDFLSALENNGAQTRHAVTIAAHDLDYESFAGEKEQPRPLVYAKVEDVIS